MDRIQLDSLLQRHFSAAETAAADPDHARAMALLAAALDEDSAGETAVSTAELAAYLDSGLDAAARRGVEDRLARSPAALAEALAAESFLLRAVPAPASATVVALAPEKSRSAWRWSGLALALAAAVVAALVLLNRAPPPTDTAIPMAVQTVPVQPAAPVQPAVPPPPVVAEKKAPPPAVVPAASPETMPVQAARKPKPALVPAASEEVMPPPRPR